MIVRNLVFYAKLYETFEIYEYFCTHKQIRIYKE
jgi:hypothetical protein